MATHPFTTAFRYVWRRHRLTLPMLSNGAGVSTRTISRWTSGQRVPEGQPLTQLVRYVASFDTTSAERIAASVGASLASLGLVTAPAGPPPITRQILAAVDSTILAAADALASPPAALRPALVAALERMRLHDLSVETALRVLAPKDEEPSPKPAAAP